MGGVTNGEAFAFGGVEFQLPIFGPAGAAVYRVLENIMAVPIFIAILLDYLQRPRGGGM